MDVSSNVRYTSPGQECGFLEPDVRVDDEEKITTSQQTAAREEIARRLNERQQQRRTAELITKQSLCRDEYPVPYTVFFLVCLSVFLSFLSCLQFFKAGKRGGSFFSQEWQRLGCKHDARTAVTGQKCASSSRFALTKGICCTTLPLCPPHDKYCCFSILIAFHFYVR